MTKEEILKCLKVKYQLSNFDKKSFKRELIPNKNYKEFINTLILLLKTQQGYVYEIYDRIPEIVATIKRKATKKERDYTSEEIELLEYFGVILGTTLEARVDFKAQYEAICKSQQFPSFSIGAYSYKVIAENNYKNYDIYLNVEPSLLENDPTFLVTVNELISLYSKSLDEQDLNKFTEILSNSDYKDENAIKTLSNSFNKRATLKRISSLLKEQNNTLEQPKTLSKKL